MQLIGHLLSERALRRQALATSGRLEWHGRHSIVYVTSMIIVAGKLQIKPYRRDEFISRSKEAVRAARSEAGCVDFSVSADSLDENRVNIFEEWKSKAELESFRGNGPGDDLFELIENAEVTEREI